jgi:trimeric autotransporter adhesin
VSFVVDDGGATDNLSDAVTRDVAVTTVNDAPTVATSDGSTEYEIGGPAVVVDASAAVADPDDTNLESAQVSISGFEAGDDLVFVDQLGISGVYNSGTGVLTLTGSASIDDYQTALSSITFQTTNEAPSATRTVEFKVNDGDDDSVTATKAIDLVEPVNEAPTVNTIEGATIWVIGDPEVAVEPGLTVNDADDTNLESAQVSISGFEAGDELVFIDQNGITGSYNSATGVLDMVGSVSLADYETALRSVAFRTSNEFPSSTRTIQFKVNDGELDSAVADKSVLIESPPPPPDPDPEP